MTRYVLDTDHLSLYGRNHSSIVKRLRSTKVPLMTTVVNLDEQLRGRLAQVAEAKDRVSLSNAYLWLSETVMMLSEFQILPYNEEASEIYETFRAQRIRVGTQDLRIASIVLAHDGILLTRNLWDFEKVPGLKIQNWSL